MTQDDLRAEIARRGGNTENVNWTTKQLKEHLKTLPDVACEPAGRGVRRGAATDATNKRKSGDVDPALEAPSNEKKKTLRGCKDDSTNKPSDALVDECEKVLLREKETTTSKEVWDAVKEQFKVTSKGGYPPRSCLADATLALAQRYARLKPNEKETSPLRWLDASNQLRKGAHHRPEATKKKEKEVTTMAKDVSTAVGEGRLAPIKHAMGTTQGVALPGTTIGLHAEKKVGDRLRAATVGDALRWRYAPPWMTRRQVDAFWRVLAKLPFSMPLYDIVEGPKGGFGLPRVDFWLALHEALAALAALEPEFASLGPLLGYMIPVHVKTFQATFGPGGGDYADAHLTSAVEENARRLQLQRSEIVRGADALVRSGDHIYTPPNASRGRLPSPNDGLRLSVAPTMKGGEFDVEAPLLGPTLSEPDDFGGNEYCGTCYTPAGAKDGHSFGNGLDVRNADMFARDNAWDHELEAAVLAAALNLGNFAAVSSWVHGDALRLAPRRFIMEQYQPEKQVEFSEITSVGVAVEIATRCAIVPSDVRVEFDPKRTHDSVLVASPDASIAPLRDNDVRMEWKALTFPNESLRVVHGAANIPGDARYCSLAIATDLGEGSSAIRAADAPFCVENVLETLDMVHELLKALDVSHDREKTFAEFLASNVVLRRARVVICSISDLDKAGIAPEKYVRRVSFDAQWPRVKADLRAALTYCLGRLDKWRKATLPAGEKVLGPRVPTGDPFKVVPPTGEGIAADITTAAAAPPALKRKAGVGGLAPVPPPPRLHPSEPRLAPWKDRVKECTAAPAKKKARKKARTE